MPMSLRSGIVAALSCFPPNLIGMPVPCDVPLDGLQAWFLRPHDFFALIMRFAMNLSR
jgi:hypothetical protein